MDKELRAELDRLWANMQAMEMIFARLTARMLTRDEITAWHADAIRAVELRHEGESPDIAANMTRALDRLLGHLRTAEGAYRPPAP